MYGVLSFGKLTGLWGWVRSVLKVERYELLGVFSFDKLKGVYGLVCFSFGHLKGLICLEGMVLTVLKN